MKQICFLFLSIIMTGALVAQQKSFYDFTVKTINGNDLSLGQFKGKKVMVVNVASQCGLTPQYEQLQKLYEKYEKDKFVIIAFPANNFKNQEPATNKEIQEFCTANYGITFYLMEKISVKGEDIAPLYQWLTSKTENGKEDAPVSWNFQKFLIDEKGNWIKAIDPKTSPMDDAIISWIESK
ncbi:MAG: glutathione peroxidase [Bacteroidales bacterium]|nr:glutathione peroxidase [Bacteroidales bacterium]